MLTKALNHNNTTTTTTPAVITEAPDSIKRLTQKWIIRMVLVVMCHNIKINPIIQCKFLLTLKMGVSLLIGTYWMQCIEFCLSFFSDMFCWHVCLSVEPNRIVRLLMVLKKTDKNIVAGWNFWLVYMNNIYWCGLSWKNMSTKGCRYKLTLKREYWWFYTAIYTMLLPL